MFVNKKESDMFSQLELVKFLHSLELLGNDMYPNESTIAELFNKSPQPSPVVELVSSDKVVEVS